jgi:DNA-binding PadR family transcriptional regulator
MTVRLGLLALLTEGPRYGAQLKAEFEARTGGAWPINIGQIYTTLQRLERDHLVIADPADDEGRIPYHLTDLGRSVVDDWWLDPVDQADAPRDQLVIKVAMAATVPGIDASRVISAQRTATMRRLQRLTRAKLHDTLDRATLLALEHQIYLVEAESRWLDHVEAVLARDAGQATITHITPTEGTPS